MESENQRVQFGKYKGKLVSWVVENDYDYALWLWKNSNSRTKTKRVVQSLINEKLINTTLNNNIMTKKEMFHKNFLNENTSINNIDMLIELENEYYITNNDKINVGDWFYCSDNTNYAYIFRCIGLTDDTHLQVSNENIFGGYGGDFKNHPYGDWSIEYSHKIVGSTKMLDGVKYLKLNIPIVIKSVCNCRVCGKETDYDLKNNLCPNCW